MNIPPTNWAGNITYRAARALEPTSLEGLQQLVADSDRVRPLGTGHSFNAIADTTGDLVSVAALPHLCVVDTERSTVTVAAGLRYGEVATHLHRAGYALPSLGSLPHISVAGAIATGTHGSGSNVGSLATAVSSLQMVTADGEVVEIDRNTNGGELAGSVVGLGALGVVTRVTLDVVPAFQMRQWVYDDMPRQSVTDHFEEILGSAHGVSLFTDWRREPFRLVWLKQRVEGPDGPQPPVRWFGATLADEPRHPIPGMPVENCTEQLGVPGPWHMRLPHFRMKFTPSSGRELQSEYLLPREHAVAALEAIGVIRDRIGPLVQSSEIRTVAGDDLWLSPSYGRDSVGIHFTWVPDAAAVGTVLGPLEEQLAPFSPRAHWGKLSAFCDVPSGRYERYPDFVALMRRFDPEAKFRNELIDRWFPEE